MIKFAVIGTGWIAEEFIKGSRLVEGFAFSAVYSRTKEKAKKFIGDEAVQIFTNINELAKSDVDAVYIASPNFLHYSQSKLMLENGKNVICEKPATVTAEEFKELCELAQKNKLVYIEAIMMLHLEARKKLENAVKKIGKITTAHFDFSQLSSKYPALKKGEVPNIFNPKMCTGCLMDLGIYCFYPAIYLFGKPKSFIASSGLLSTGADGWGTAVLDYDDKQITLTYSKLGESANGSEILGDEGTIKMASVSKLTGMLLIDNEANKTELAGDVEKHVLMSGEAKDFCMYINEYKRNKNKMDECNKITYEVLSLMQQVRKVTGIKFDIE